MAHGSGPSRAVAVGAGVATAGGGVVFVTAVPGVVFVTAASGVETGGPGVAFGGGGALDDGVAAGEDRTAGGGTACAHPGVPTGEGTAGARAEDESEGSGRTGDDQGVRTDVLDPWKSGFS